MNENPVAWTEADFDQMSWHDNHVHGLHIRSGEDGFGEEWNIDLNSPEGSVSFHASGFAQVLRGPVQLTIAQWLDPPQRIPNDA